MNKIAPVLPELLAGSADLTGPSRLYAKCFTDMQPETVRICLLVVLILIVYEHCCHLDVHAGFGEKSMRVK